MKQLCLLFLFLNIVMPSFAQDNIQSDQSLAIDSLKSEVRELKEELRQHTLRVENFEKTYSVKETDIKHYVQTNYLKWWVVYGWIIITVLSLIALTSIWAFINRIINKRITVEVGKRVSEITANEKKLKALEDKINNQVATYRFKRDMQITVLYTGDKQNSVEDYFNANGFEKINWEKINSGVTDLGFLNETDILFIENMENDFGFPKNKEDVVDLDELIIKPIIDKIKGELPKLAVFYFTDKGFQFPRVYDSGLNSNFANSFASLYHNLIDLMRYKWVVLDKKPLDA